MAAGARPAPFSAVGCSAGGGQPHRAASAGLRPGSSPRAAALSLALQQALRALRETTQATVIVLDIDPAIRQRRIGARIECGTVDPFDRYMLADRVRAERIEGGLVELAIRYLNAAVIENDDLDAAALERELERVLGRPAPFPSP